MLKKSCNTKAPFGVSSIRFESIGFHPGLDTQGLMKKNKLQLSPGQYNPQFFECGYKKYNVGGSSWKRKADLEEFSKNLGFPNPKILKNRAFFKTMGGPGLYEIPEECFKKQTSSCKRNVGFGLQKRFWDPIKHNNPPPGTYTKSLEKQSTMNDRQFTYLPPFEWDNFIDRFKDNSPPYRKPPNLYNPKAEGTLSALLEKVVSKRGPYDLFTGPRDGSTIKNHFAPSSFKGPLNWFNTWPTDLDILLNHRLKQGKGRFLKEVRFGKPTSYNMLTDPALCYRDPNEPSPCQYHPESPKEFKENLAPFNKSEKDARPPMKWIIHPSVGRYSPKPTTCSKMKKESWMFASTTGRTEYKAVEYNCF